jgi:hypothetical protein
MLPQPARSADFPTTRNRGGAPRADDDATD